MEHLKTIFQIEKWKNDFSHCFPQGFPWSSDVSGLYRYFYGIRGPLGRSERLIFVKKSWKNPEYMQPPPLVSWLRDIYSAIKHRKTIFQIEKWKNHFSHKFPQGSLGSFRPPWWALLEYSAMLEYSMGLKNFIFWKYAISAFKRRVWRPFMIIRKKKAPLWRKI